MTAESKIGVQNPLQYRAKVVMRKDLKYNSVAKV